MNRTHLFQNQSCHHVWPNWYSCHWKKSKKKDFASRRNFWRTKSSKEKGSSSRTIGICRIENSICRYSDFGRRCGIKFLCQLAIIQKVHWRQWYSAFQICCYCNVNQLVSRNCGCHTLPFHVQTQVGVNTSSNDFHSFVATGFLSCSSIAGIYCTFVLQTKGETNNKTCKNYIIHIAQLVHMTTFQTLFHNIAEYVKLNLISNAWIIRKGITMMQLTRFCKIWQDLLMEFQEDLGHHFNSTCR